VAGAGGAAAARDHRADLAPCAECGELAGLRAELAARVAAAEDEGRAAGLREVAELRARLASTVDALDATHAASVRAAVDAIVDVGLALCAELAPAAATLDRAGVAALVAQVVGAAGDQVVTLRAHPDDAAALGAELPPALRIEADPSLAPGELRAHGVRQVIDASWATRLAALREPLVALLRAGVEAPS
jgi:flagellar biosynthesis/type III secretory pathway protein FliH